MKIYHDPKKYKGPAKPRIHRLVRAFSRLIGFLSIHSEQSFYLVNHFLKGLT
jgi:hypothetical protein